ncbi:putative 60S ribosomal protein L28e [Cytospora mali]|uniref:60S ribosomal protein L28e n=1 Tax=Cytospora mali TaxID=578113 RepID=A0A194VKU0_CYTMA|nr:putative 60S ribosomal protein L28e [Valsa mali]
MALSNVSSDLVWEIVRNNNSFLVKRNEAGGVQLSRDPLNLANKNSRKVRRAWNCYYCYDYGGQEERGRQARADMLIVFFHQHAGFINEKAVGITADGEKGVQVTSKKATVVHQPAKAGVKRTFGSHNRKTYKNIANATAKSGYRPDLREAAVARASAIRRSQRPVKAEPEKKLRGNAAKKAAQE